MASPLGTTAAPGGPTGTGAPPNPLLNFAPIVLHVPQEVMVNNVNLAIELENLSYFVQH